MNFLPLPHGHFSLRPTLRPCVTSSKRRREAAVSTQSTQVHAAPCSEYQLVRSRPITIASIILQGYHKGEIVQLKLEEK